MDKKKKTNLGKTVFIFDSIEDFNKSIDHDVKVFVPEMEALISHFNIKNPYDVSVILSLLINALASTLVASEIEEGENDRWVEEYYKRALEENRKAKREGRFWIR